MLWFESFFFFGQRPQVLLLLGRVARWYTAKKINLGKKFGFAKVEVGIFYCHLVYFMAILYNLWPFGIVVGEWLYFPPFG
jgi:hypothetical protein